MGRGKRGSERERAWLGKGDDENEEITAACQPPLGILWDGGAKANERSNV